MQPITRPADIGCHTTIEQHPEVQPRPEVLQRPGDLLTLSRRRSRRGTAEIRIRGDIDMLSAPSLARHVARHGTGCARLVLDLRQVTFCDARGVQVLIEAGHAARENGVEMLVVVEAASMTERVLRLCRAGRELRIATQPGLVATQPGLVAAQDGPGGRG
ncbi:STAS domain-containing protein [Pseudonocardia sp. KRD291]|uniref:STAS domain-containing protein n=1 Tax=Pseudonocardia sp. KRD291 TaxID=2792007 RepID=UPI001C4A5F81|nr:STAS domain-containing protein [Pseudonocardia sp. KRD291]MBW0101330.1 STAS domain-containing protein [Pseudonocardia sp. KRD291]